MSTFSSPSRAEELLHEAVEMGAEDVYLQTEGERLKVRYRVSGRIVQKLDGFVPDAGNVLGELRLLASQDDSAEEAEGLGSFAFAGKEGSVWVRVYWFQEEGVDAVVVSIFQSRLTFDELGLNPRDTATLDELISLPQGVLIGCGMDGGGHATTLNALVERLAQSGKRVVLLGEAPKTPLENVTHIELEDDELSTQVELLAGHFDAFALGRLDSPSKVRAAFDLASEGHLVLGLIYSFPVYTAMSRFAHEGIAPEAIQAHFVGGWSQRLVKRANQEGQMGLFNCVSQKTARRQFLAWQEAGYQELDAQEEDALWQDAEEKIAQGLITREDVAKVLQPLEN